MKRRNGFSLIELLVAMAVLIIVAAAAVGALVQAQHVTTAVGLQANAQQNLRAGMHEMVHDFLQAGEGIPTAGVTVPNTAGASAIPRPGPGGAAAFFPATATLAQVTPGWQLGEDAKTVNPVTLAVQDGLLKTDFITVLYVDDTLVSSAVGPGGIPAPQLNAYPVVNPAAPGPACAGVLNAAGTSVTLAPTCFTLPGGPIPISPGDLIMFHNTNGSALEMVTAVNAGGGILTFAAGDPAGLNGSGAPNGTVTSLNVAATPTDISRVWMVTYYVDSNTNPSRPQLIRQVNYPNYPSVAAPTYPAQPVADIIENLSFSYNLLNSTAPAGTYLNGPGDAPTPVAPDTPFNIRAINVTLAARSEYPYTANTVPQYFRNNLNSQVSVRSMAFVNAFPTPTTLP
jgi:prepilin-type N-terminal cleavage/methylation domain-containing protein